MASEQVLAFESVPNLEMSGSQPDRVLNVRFVV
jgi:hypothetical protein